jgi:hypothetical protein
MTPGLKHVLRRAFGIDAARTDADLGITVLWKGLDRDEALSAAPPARPSLHVELTDLGGATACGHALKPASASSASQFASTNSLSIVGLRSIALSDSSHSGT